MHATAAEGCTEETPPVATTGTGQLVLERRADGRLYARVHGEPRIVHVRRCFPWSEPGQFVSLRDAEGEEIALVEHPHELDDASRRALEEALADAGFVFAVTAVLEIEEEVELRRWRVHTQQGTRTFQTRLDDWPRTLADGSLLIRDVTGDLYRLPEPAGLDRTSRTLLWAFVD